MGEYFDMKERRGSMDEVDRDPEVDVESMPSSTSSSNFILEGCGRSRSHQYPQAPSPLHFTHLNSPNPNSYFMPSPLRSHNFDKPRRRRRRFVTRLCCCCCSLCSVIVTAGILLGLAAFITWLILRPIHAPRYSFDNIEFSSLSVIAPNFSLNADVVFTITAENPNRRLGFKYEGIGIEISYRGDVFGHSSVSPFALDHGTVTSLTSELVEENYFFTPVTLGQDLSADVKLARVALHVRASAKVRVKVGIITSFAVKVFVDCDVIVKPPHGNATSSLIDKTCKLTR